MGPYVAKRGRLGGKTRLTHFPKTAPKPKARYVQPVGIGLKSYGGASNNLGPMMVIPTDQPNRDP
jgi:hypothetical protein